MRIKTIFAILIVILSSGCAGGIIQRNPIGNNPTALPSETPQGNGAAEGTQSAPVANNPVTITLWIPDNFAITAREQVQKLLDDRIRAFTQTNPDIKVDLRYKNIGTQENMMELLNTTSRVAPNILPDIVLLHRNDMEIAALKGLLVPMDAYVVNSEANEPYRGYSSLGKLQGSLFGLPAAGDALILIGAKPNSPQYSGWDEIFSSGTEIGTNFSDPGSTTAVALYISAGGLLVDESGKPHLDKEALTKLVTTIRLAKEHSVFPEWTVLSSDWVDVSKHFQSGDPNFEINWYSSARSSNLIDYSFQALPGLDTKPATVLTGWYWSVANPAPERQAACRKLLSSLYEPVFADIWSDTAGYLPISSQTWPQTDAIHQQLQKILNNAQPLPDTSILITVGPVIRDAVIRAYTTNDPVEVIAAAAIARINQ